MSYRARHGSTASPRLGDLMRSLNASTDPTALRAYTASMRSRGQDAAPADLARQTSADILRAAGTAYAAQAGSIGQKETMAMLLG